MPPFAPQLQAQIGFEQAIPTPASPSAGAAIGDAFQDVAKIADKWLEDNKPRKVTYAEIKDESELATFQNYQRGMDEAHQLRQQGFPGQADAVERQTADAASFAGADTSDPQYSSYYVRTTGRPKEQQGMTSEQYAVYQARQSDSYKTGILAGRSNPDLTDAQRDALALTHSVRIAAANATMESTKAIRGATAAINESKWDSTLFPAYMELLREGPAALLGSAEQASREGRTIDPKSIVDAQMMTLQHFRDVFANHPRPHGVTEDQWKAVTNYTASVEAGYTAIIGKGARMEQAMKANWMRAVESTGLGETAKRVLANADAEQLAALNKDFPWDEVFTAVDKAGKGADGKPLEAWTIPSSLKPPGASGLPTGKPEGGWIPKNVLKTVTGDPNQIAKQVKNLASAMNMTDVPNLDKDQASSEGVILWSQKLAASVSQSPSVFAIPDLRNVYDGKIIKALRQVGTQNPEAVIVAFRQHQQALDAMADKALAAITSPGDGAFNVNEAGTVTLDWDTLAQKYNSGSLLSAVPTEMQIAVAPYNGDFAAFKKEYEKGTGAGNLGGGTYSRLAPKQRRTDYPPAVQWFMDQSPDMKEYNKNLVGLTEQSASLRELRNTSKRMGREADNLQKAYEDDQNIPAGDENVPLVSSPVPIPRPRPDLPVEPEVVQEPERRGGILGLGGFPQTDGVPLGERAVGKIGEAVGGAASYVGNALISPANGATYVNPLATAIGKKESRGSYNTTNRGTATGGVIVGSDYKTLRSVMRDDGNGGTVTEAVLLSEMTMDEIAKLQKIKDPKDPQRIFAAGLYQIIPTTMEGFRKAHPEVKGSDIFDPAMQDKAFEYLIYEVRRDVGRYISGDIAGDKDKALLALAQEWASFPVPYDMVVNGRSIKKGDSYHGGGNKAGISLNDAGAILDGMRGPEPVPRPRPNIQEITAEVNKTVPDATPKDIEEATNILQGTNTLGTLSALGDRQRYIMMSILNAYSGFSQ